MAKNKTTETDKDVSAFISEFAVTEQKRKDSYELIDLMKNVSGYDARMWGPSIIGFGSYHYKYESGHEGDTPYIAFSPRKAAISLYVHTGLKEHEYLLDDFGKFRIAKSCIYIRKLSDIDREKLVTLMNATINHLKLKYNKDYRSL